MTTVDLEQQRLLIGGEWVEASGGGTFERNDPLTGETVTRRRGGGPTSSAACSSSAARRPRSCSADADLDAAADAASFGAFVNSGQICMSTERIVADRAIAADLGAKLAERAGQARDRRPADDQGTMIGPVVSDASRERCSS